MHDFAPEFPNATKQEILILNTEYQNYWTAQNKLEQNRHFNNWFRLKKELTKREAKMNNEETHDLDKYL